MPATPAARIMPESTTAQRFCSTCDSLPPHVLIAERSKVSGFGPRDERESKRIRCWAEVRSTLELGVAILAPTPAKLQNRHEQDQADGHHHLEKNQRVDAKADFLHRRVAV